MLRKKGDLSCSSRVFASLRLCVELLNTHQSVNICKNHSSLWKKYLWVIASVTVPDVLFFLSSYQKKRTAILAVLKTRKC